MRKAGKLLAARCPLGLCTGRVSLQASRWSTSYFPCLGPVRSISSQESKRSAAQPIRPITNGEKAAVPWYLRSSQTTDSIDIQLPELPENAPESLSKLCEFMLKDLGLEDLRVLDLRGQDFQNNPFGTNAIMVICCGKSERHLSKAAKEMSSWLKHTNHRSGYAEGILSSNMLRVYQRRLKKKTQKQSRYVQADDLDFQDGSSNNLNSLNSLKKVSSWIALDAKLDGIFVHLFSKEKRKEVDLDSFWSSSSERELLIAPETDFQANSAPNRFERLYKVPNSRSYSTISNRLYSTTVSAPPVISSDPVVAQLKSHINYLSKVNAQKTSTAEQDVTKLGLESDIVKDMLKVFPSEATAEHWYLRLLLISELRSLNPTEFPLKVLVDHLLYQQASGIPISPWDVEYVIKRIAYDSEKVSDFAQAQPDFETLSKWQQVCSEKLHLILQLHDIAFRATGEKMSTNDDIMALLLRMLVSPGADSFSASDAVANPLPLASTPVDVNTGQQFGRGFVDNRAISIIDNLYPTLEMLKPSETVMKHLTKPIIALILTSLVNGGLWTEFWTFWTKLTKAAKVDSDISCLMVSLVAKSGSENAVTLLIEKQLPAFFLSNGTDMISIEMINALNKCLDYLDPEQRSYSGLREFMKIQREKLESSGVHDNTSTQ